MLDCTCSGLTSMDDDSSSRLQDATIKKDYGEGSAETLLLGVDLE